MFFLLISRLEVSSAEGSTQTPIEGFIPNNPPPWNVAPILTVRRYCHRSRFNISLIVCHRDSLPMACICRGFIHTDLASPITYGTTTVSQPVSHLLLFHTCGGPNRSCEINERRRGVMGGRGWLQSHVLCRNQGVPRHLIRRLCLVQCTPRFTSCIVTAGEMVRQGQISKPWGASLRARGGGWRSEAVRISQSDRWPYRWPLSEVTSECSRLIK